MSEINKNQFGSKFLILFFIASNLFWVGGLMVNFEYTPYKEIRTLGQNFKKAIKKLVTGETQKKNQTQTTVINNTIESSVLPLKKQYFSLEEYHLDLNNTILSVIEDKVFLSDSLGESLAFDGQQIVDKQIFDKPFKSSFVTQKQTIATYAVNPKGHEEIFLTANKLKSYTAKNKQLPFFAFVPAVGITSIIQLSGFNERWDGDLLIASLEMQSLYRLKIVEDKVVFNEPIWIGHPVLDMVQFENNIVLLTKDSQLISLKVDETLLAKNLKGNNMMAILPSLSKCTSCHQFTPTTPLSMAPSLENIFNKKIGGDPLFNRYTAALKNKPGIWNEDNLRAYIKNPGEFIPGTAMPTIGLNDDEVEAIINTLSNPLRK